MMTTNVLFVQGGGAGTHDEWDDKLVASLERELGDGYTVHYPRMPDEGDPDAGAWQQAIATELDTLGDAIVVGHSIGAAILLDFIGEHPAAAAFLIACPYIGERGWPSEELRPTNTLELEMPLYFYQGDRDETVPTEHVEYIAAAHPDAVIRRLRGRDHQLDGNLAEVAADIRALRTS